MSAESLALLEALDALNECQRTDVERSMRLDAIYQAGLDAVLSRCPNLSRQTLEDLVARRYQQWLRAQRNPTSLPPTA
jgi:RNA-binding protein YlmH